MINSQAQSYYLGLDFGTSGARACLMDHNEQIVWNAQTTYNNPNNQIPQDWRTALYTLLSRLPRERAAQIDHIALNGTSGTVILCDNNLMPISHTLLYNDARATQQVHYLKTIAPANHPTLTPTSGLAKFCWLNQQHYGEKAGFFLHQADWLTALLAEETGISDYHNALKTGYDVENMCWPDWILNMPHSQILPKVYAPGQVISPIRAEMADHFGIKDSCLIHAGTTDSTAAFIATGVKDTHTGVTALGTTLVLKQLSEHRIEAPEYGVYSHKFGQLWLVGGASNTGAGILRHYFDDEQLESLSAQIQPEQNSPFDYYPLLRPGERFPFNDPNYPPRLDPRPDCDVAFLHGLLQSLARIEHAGYQRLQQLGAPEINNVISNGGGSRSDTWRQIRQHTLQLLIKTSEHSEAAYGCALLAKQGCQ